jgi:hypothetical protein
MLVVYALCSKIAQGGGAVVVVAYARANADGASQPGRRDGLIGTFAAKSSAKV